MTRAELDHLCAMAMQRITITINRSAGQHLRAMRASWAAQKGGAE